MQEQTFRKQSIHLPACSITKALKEMHCRRHLAGLSQTTAHIFSKAHCSAPLGDQGGDLMHHQGQRRQSRRKPDTRGPRGSFRVSGGTRRICAASLDAVMCF